MLLRVPVGHGPMGLVGVTGYSYLVGGRAPALKAGRPDLDADRDRLHVLALSRCSS